MATGFPPGGFTPPKGELNVDIISKKQKILMSFFSNFISIYFNENEFVIDFAQQPIREDEMPTVRIFMTPKQFDKLVEATNNAYNEFLSKHGLQP